MNARRGSYDTGGQGSRAGESEQRSLEQLVPDITADLTKLMRQELELTRAELRQEAKKAGMGGGMLGAGAVGLWIAAVMGSLALMFGLAAIDALNLGWSALIVAVIWAVAGAVLLLIGKRQVQNIGPPKRAVESLKEDTQWAKSQAK